MLGHGIAPGWGCTSELQFLACSWAKSLALAAPRVNADLAVSKAGASGPGQSRTADLRFRKPLLYPSELRGQCCGSQFYTATVFFLSAFCPNLEHKAAHKTPLSA